MRFRAERDDLLSAVQAVSGVVAGKGVHPVYESVEIIATPDGLTLLATDLEIGMKLRLPAGERLKVERPGTAVVPAQRLAAIVRELPKGELAFAWNPDQRESTIEAGRGRFKLQGQSPEDFPEVPEVDDAQSVAVPAPLFRTMVRRTQFAAAKERMRFALNGVLVRVEGDEVELVATDGRRLARDCAPCTNASNAKIQAIVPTKGLLQVDRVLEPADEFVRIAVGNNQFCARTTRVTIVSRLVEGSFPNYRDVIPQNCKQKAVIQRAALIASLRRAALVTSRDSQSVRLQFHPEGLTISARSPEGSAEETLACDFAGTGDVLGYNPEFLLDALNVLTAESVPFEWDGKTAPGKLTEGSYTYVVMPVSLD
jgi:DNA polymerase III subunit beta